MDFQEVTSPSIPYPTLFASEYNVANFYCAGVAIEAVGYTLWKTAVAVSFLGKGVIEVIANKGREENEIVPSETLHSEFFTPAENTFYEAGGHASTAVLYGLGALYPLAGCVIPIALCLKENYNRADYFVPRLLKPISCFLRGITEQNRESYNIPQSVAQVATGIAAIAAACFVFGVSPLPDLSSFEVLPIQIRIG